MHSRVFCHLVIAAYFDLIAVIDRIIMSSSSGGDLRAGKSPAPSKIKTHLNSHHGSDPNFEVVTSKKNQRKFKKLNNTTSSPTSPGLQQIIDNTPLLIASNSTFNYDKLLPTNATPPSDMVVDDVTITDNTNESYNSNLSVSTSTPAGPNVINNSLRCNLQSFPSHYTGPIFILVESIDTEKNLGKWHPIKAAKFFSTNFTGVTNIKPAGFKKVKITFDSIEHGNLCLMSAFLKDYGFGASIPSNLIYSFGVIKLDADFAEDDFREGLSSPFPIESFKRITVNKNGIITPTRLVELKFISPKLPQHITVFNMIFEVTPSIRSPVQCSRCLRFGHTQKFCRSDPRCSHCGGVNHSIVDCPTVSATDPSCLYCHLPHVATDRRCQEWSVQKEIKKIMAIENISYQDAVIFKKNNCYSSAFKYSDVTNRQPPAPNENVPNPSRYVEDFPNLNDSHHFFNSKKPKSNARPLSPTKKNFSLSSKPSYSPPNGSYLTQSPAQGQTPVNKIMDFSWVHSLSNILADALINSPTLSSPFSPSVLQSLIESSLHSLLIVPTPNDS